MKDTKPSDGFWRQLGSVAASSPRYLLPLGPVVEEEKTTYHKHWFVLLRSTIVPAIALVVSIVILFGALSVGDRSIIPHLSQLGSLASAISILWLFWRYDNWRNDFYVVARDRLIDVDRLPLGMRTEVREASLGNVQNLSLRIPNFIAAFFDYGDVVINTAGKQGQLVFESVGRPREVLAEISVKLDVFQGQRKAKERADRDRDMLSWFSADADLGRIVVLRNPHTVKAGDLVEVEWRIAGSPSKVETRLQWDIEPRPNRDYAFRTDLQSGGVGNYLARFSPPAGMAYFAITAQIDGCPYYSVVHEVRVE